MKKVKNGLWCKMFHRRIRSFLCVEHSNIRDYQLTFKGLRNRPSFHLGLGVQGTMAIFF